MAIGTHARTVHPSEGAGRSEKCQILDVLCKTLSPLPDEVTLTSSEYCWASARRNSIAPASPLTTRITVGLSYSFATPHRV
jgi:hypothetical protein